MRDHIRLTAQPFDAPPDKAGIEMLIEQIGSDRMLLFASDYPHWQFDGNDPVPPHLPAALVQRMCVDNPLETFPRSRADSCEATSIAERGRHDERHRPRLARETPKPASKTGGAEQPAPARASRSSTATSTRACRTAVRSCRSWHKRWQRAFHGAYGDHLRTPFLGTTPYPRSSPLIARRDAWPPTGGNPGSDLDFMRQQHLDANDIEFGILQVLDLFIFSQQNLEFGAAIQRAINEWQLECWCKPEPRLKASILVGQDDVEAAIAEIERCAKVGGYVQINVCPRANEPLGRRRYWPIYERAQELDLPLGIHVGGYGGHAPTASGHPSYYNEEHHSNAHSMASQLTSFVIEGVPERFPKPEIRVHRGRLRLGAGHDLAHGPAFRALPQSRCRT